jgi:hypothetical protein
MNCTRDQFIPALITLTNTVVAPGTVETGDERYLLQPARRSDRGLIVMEAFKYVLIRKDLFRPEELAQLESDGHIRLGTPVAGETELPYLRPLGPGIEFGSMSVSHDPERIFVNAQCFDPVFGDYFVTLLTQIGEIWTEAGPMIQKQLGLIQDAEAAAPLPNPTEPPLTATVLYVAGSLQDCFDVILASHLPMLTTAGGTYWDPGLEGTGDDDEAHWTLKFAFAPPDGRRVTRIDGIAVDSFRLSATCTRLHLRCLDPLLVPRFDLLIDIIRANLTHGLSLDALLARVEASDSAKSRDASETTGERPSGPEALGAVVSSPDGDAPAPQQVESATSVSARDGIEGTDFSPPVIELPARKRDRERWQLIWDAIRAMAYGSYTIKAMITHLKRHHPEIRGASDDVLPKIIAAGKAGLLNRP